MAVATAETQDIGQPPTVKDRIVDAARRVAHVSHEVRLAKSVARDTIEDGVYAAKRTLKRVQRGVDTLEDAREQTARYVKRQPFTALGIAAGVGVLVGACVGWFSARRRWSGRRPHARANLAPIVDEVDDRLRRVIASL